MMAQATVTVSVKDAPTVQRLIRSENNVVAAWDRLCRCNDEFLPDYPQACGEYQDHLDTAIIELKGVMAGDND